MNPVLIYLFALMIAFSSVNDARKANEAYRSGDYETAVSLYQSAIEQNPNDARLHFNLATVYSTMGEQEKALETYETFKQLSDSAPEQSRADYNAGTMFSQAEMYDEALNHFREALKRNPNDPDAKYNYEMALRKQQEQQQEDEQNQDDSDENEDGDDDQQQDPDSGDNDDEQQDQDQDSSQQDGDPEDQGSDREELPQPIELSQEEAENILNALEQLERELLEDRKKEATDQSSSNDKDW